MAHETSLKYASISFRTFVWLQHMISIDVFLCILKWMLQQTLLNEIVAHLMNMAVGFDSVHRLSVSCQA
jgi:hypothetical protein